MKVVSGDLVSNYLNYSPSYGCVGDRGDVYVKTYQNTSTNWILSGDLGILKITQRQHNTHTKTVSRDKFVKSNCSAVQISQVNIGIGKIMALV